MVDTYQQPVKEHSRNIVWTHAINSLTSERERSGLVSKVWCEPIWERTTNRLAELDYELHSTAFDNFQSAVSAGYGSRRPQDLKVAYLCGPEPENDLNVLVRLGISPSNVWAIESDKRTAAAAIESARQAYPNLKIFPGSLEQFAELTMERFDIIYLDMTGHFLSRESHPYRAIHTTLNAGILAPLCVLITNLSVPDFDEEMLQFMGDYFWPMDFVEKTVFGNDYTEESCREWAWTDGPISSGYVDQEALVEKIREAPERAYSALLSHYPVAFAADVVPWARIGRSRAATSMFLKGDIKSIDMAWGQLWDMDDDARHAGGMEMNPGAYAFSHFISTLVKRRTAQNYLAGFNDRKGEWISALKLRDVVVNWIEGFSEILSDRMLDGMSKTKNALLDPRGGVFCDVPLANLWAQFCGFQLGYGWHPNLSMQRRFSYQAKVRSMFIDVHILDQARPLYDHFGLLDLLGDGITDPGMQLALRCGIDSVHKHGGMAGHGVYAGGNLVSWSESPHSEDLTFREKL